MTGHIEQWHIWMASVKYEDSDEVKKRPVLIINSNPHLVVALKMTGTDRGDRFPEHRIRHWREAGLSKETSVRLDKILRLTPTVLTTYVGKLTVQDIFLIQTKLAQGRSQ